MVKPDAELTLKKAKELVSFLEDGDAEHAHAVINELYTDERSTLYHEIGTLTRELHTLLSSVGIQGVTEQLPSTQDRLNRVVEIMEAAANRTIEQIEDATPLPQSLANIAGHLLREGVKVETKEMSVEDFPNYYKSMMFFLRSVVDNSETMRLKLREIVVAQDFQDLTGQSLLKVMAAVEDIELKLVEVVKKSAEVFHFDDINGYKNRINSADVDVSPEFSVNSNSEDTVKSQDDVDDILGELGF